MGQKDAEFEWITDHIPTREEIEEEQGNRGYHYMGYGCAFSIKTVELPNDKHPVVAKGMKVYMTTWKCNGSCD